MNTKKQIILFDLTYLEKMSSFTGIERVMLDTLDFFVNEDFFHVIFVRLKGHRLIEVDKSEMDIIRRNIMSNSRLKKVRKKTKLKFQVISQWFIKSIAYLITYKPYRIDTKLLQELQKFSHLNKIYIDVGINQISNFVFVIRELKETSVKVIFYCHDVFPLQKLGGVTHPWSKSFHDYLTLLRQADRILVPSLETKLAVRQAINISYIPIDINPTPYFDFKNIYECTHKHVSPERKTFVYVSSMIPRKNHRLLLEELSRNMELRKSIAFLLIGSIPRSGKWTVKFVKKLNRSGGDVTILSNISDACLKNIYMNSYAGLYLSSAEGFGLPIHEQLQFGKKVLVSSNLRSLFADSRDKLVWFNPEVDGDLGTQILRLAGSDDFNSVSPLIDKGTNADRWGDFRRVFQNLNDFPE